jgi:hypothetical protein
MSDAGLGSAHVGRRLRQSGGRRLKRVHQLGRMQRVHQVGIMQRVNQLSMMHEHPSPGLDRPLAHARMPACVPVVALG